MAKKPRFTFSDVWDARFMELAKMIATWSKDTSTKVGCVIIGPDKEIRSTGYNGFPRGVDDTIPARHERPAKYDFTEHAERNAIYNASLYGASVKNCIMYVTFPPCADCARGIIQSGIREVIYLDMPADKTQNIPGWRDKLEISFKMFDEAGVIYKSLGVNNIKSK
jgi:dCMP deaminase